MIKVKCYSIIASLVYILLLISTLIVVFLSILLFEDHGIAIFNIIWGIIISLCVLFSIFGILHNHQYLYVKENKFILKSPLYTIKVLDISECYYAVERLQSYYNRTYVLENWICIYSFNESNKFKYGFSNGRKYKRIQLIYNEINLKFVDSYIQKSEN